MWTIFVSMLILVSVYFTLPIVDYERISNHIFILLLLFPIYFLVNWFLHNYRDKLFFHSCIFSLFLASSLVLGEELTLYSQTFFSLNTIIKIVLMIVVLICPVYFIFYQMSTISLERTIGYKGASVRIYFVCELILICGWGFILLLYYPGIFSYDSQFQVIELYGSGGLSTQHPLLHTFMLKSIFLIGDVVGDIQTGAVIITIVQMLICSSIVSYSCVGLTKAGFSLKWIYILIGYYAFFPICSIFPIVATKDVLFSFLFMLVVVSILRWQNEKERWKSKRTYFELFGLLFIAGIFRYNFVYAIIIGGSIIGIILSVYREKKIRNFVLLTIALSSLSIRLFNDILVDNTGAVTRLEGEAYSVPLQQLARAYKNSPDSFSSSDIVLLMDFVPVESLNKYNPRISDPVKSNFSSSPGIYNLMKLWVTVGLKAPKQYVDAFLMNTQPYWDPNFQFPDRYYKGPIIEMFTRSPQINREVYAEKSLFPKLANYYRESIVTDEIFKKIPLFSLFFNSGFIIWIILIIFFMNMYKRNFTELPVFIFLFSYLLTLLMGPVMIVRYALPFFLVWPILVLYALSSKMENGLYSKE